MFVLEADAAMYGTCEAVLRCLNHAFRASQCGEYAFFCVRSLFLRFHRNHHHHKTSIPMPHNIIQHTHTHKHTNIYGYDVHHIYTNSYKCIIKSHLDTLFGTSWVTCRLEHSTHSFGKQAISTGISISASMYSYLFAPETKRSVNSIILSNQFQ